MGQHGAEGVCGVGWGAGDTTDTTADAIPKSHGLKGAHCIPSSASKSGRPLGVAPRQGKAHGSRLAYVYGLGNGHQPNSRQGTMRTDVARMHVQRRAGLQVFT